ncbi:MAG: helix-turn-helix transcriptional regulator [Nitrospiraceae bacterium]|nr:helix-turn-helix transcriptional regulator [Nitrospiraceae bacterium]
MTNLPLFIRSVREAQGITQGELKEKANALGIAISQSAIAQFEKMKATISLEKLIAIAPLLNLNPVFIESGTGNPFRQSNKERIINIFLPEDIFGKPDYDLIKTIAESNKKALFIFVKPNPRSYSNLRKISSLSETDDPIFALLVKDEDENIFLFRRKKSIDFLAGGALEAELEAIASRDKKYLEVQWQVFDSPDWEVIKSLETDYDKVRCVFKDTEKRRILSFLLFTINSIYQDLLISEKDTYDKIRKILGQMDYEELDDFAKKMGQEFSNFIRKNLNIS